MMPTYIQLSVVLTGKMYSYITDNTIILFTTSHSEIKNNIIDYVIICTFMIFIKIRNYDFLTVIKLYFNLLIHFYKT